MSKKKKVPEGVPVDKPLDILIFGKESPLRVEVYPDKVSIIPLMKSGISHLDRLHAGKLSRALKEFYNSPEPTA